MTLKSVFAICAIVLLAVSCTPKAEKAVETAPAAASVVAPADIKDPAAWTAAYDAIIASYSEASAKANAGNPAALTEAENISKQADVLNAAAETIGASLSGQAQADFAAKVLEYKEKFKAAASS
ncbi:MAG: hypothetical protein Q8O15_11570 [Rectinemataceae bacterium]|nr:hypothetical protein [Rectinemataceae bacterium]